MASGDPSFERLLKELRPNLAKQGFRRTGQNFVIESDQCRGIINFQKTLYRTAGQTEFTVNVAVASKRLLRLYGQRQDKPPRHYDCHWEVRIGHFMPDHRDKWWTLSDEASYRTAISDLDEMLATKVLPLLKRHLSERELLALWDWSVGGFEYPMLKHKSVLLAEQGRMEELPAIFKRIREICLGGAAEAGAEQHIREVQQRFCVRVQ